MLIYLQFSLFYKSSFNLRISIRSYFKKDRCVKCVMLTFDLRKDLNRIVPVFKKCKRNLNFGDSEIYFCQ